MPVREEWGITTTGVSDAGGAPLLADLDWVPRVQPLAGVQGAEHPGLAFLLHPRIDQHTAAGGAAFEGHDGVQVFGGFGDC